MQCSKIILFLIRINIISYILIFFGLALILTTVTIFFPDNASNIEKSIQIETVLDKIVFGIIIVPIIETLIFQTFIISVTCKLLKRPKYKFYVSLFISSLAFSFNHSYNYYYMIYTFLIGILLACMYYIARYRRFSATLSLIILHSIWNSLILFTN